MKIEGFGNINPVDTVKTNKTQTGATEFESILKKAFDEGDKAKLREACNEFEAIMLQMLYKQMKATVPESDFIEKSSAREIFEDMLDEELMTRGSMRGVGIAEMMYKQLSTQMDKVYKFEKAEEASEANDSEPDNTETDGAEPVEE
jgi:flagellar protein FlgJ